MTGRDFRVNLNEQEPTCSQDRPLSTGPVAIFEPNTACFPRRLLDGLMGIVRKAARQQNAGTFCGTPKGC